LYNPKWLPITAPYPIKPNLYCTQIELKKNNNKKIEKVVDW